MRQGEPVMLMQAAGNRDPRVYADPFFGALVQRFERIEVLDRALAYMPQIVFRELFSLNVRFHPRGTAGMTVRSLTA